MVSRQSAVRDQQQQSAVSSQRSAVSGQRSAVSSQQLAVSGQRSAVSSQRSAVSGQRSAVSGQRSAVSGQQSAVSSQRSAKARAGDGIECTLNPDRRRRGQDGTRYGGDGRAVVEWAFWVNRGAQNIRQICVRLQPGSNSGGQRQL